MYKKILALLLTFIFIFSISACFQKIPQNEPDLDITGTATQNLPVVHEQSKETQSAEETKPTEEIQQTITEIEEAASYSSKDEVAAYINKFNKLPKNFITKAEANKLGWESNKGNLWEVADKKSIGGDRFANREGLLPDADGRKWYECDIDYNGGFRGAKRIVYSNDGLIYYSDDHYESFTKLY